MKRLNDTIAIQRAPGFPDDLHEGQRDVHHSLTTRQVENGYVTKETNCHNGEYQHREYFHEEPIKDSRSSMARAVAHLKK